ncbi:hypothetical protein [Modestobacter marinus]|uniref:hypothetical protein n=1 Tax=Modestobacter marinus TaxID=477641 RepID=UPI001C9578B8|nr:hypothetical protein [Modestobacter marinus]
MGSSRDDEAAAPSAGPSRPPVPPPARSASVRPTASPRPAARPAAPAVPAVQPAAPVTQVSPAAAPVHPAAVPAGPAAVPAGPAAIPAGPASALATEAADDAAPRRRFPWPAVGLVLAAAATVAVFVTDNALVLRIALLAVCWAVVGAAFLTGDRHGDRGTAPADELRDPRDREETLQDSRLRRAAEQGMREEIAQLRTELAAVGGLRTELAGVGQLRDELAALGQLRAEVAALTQLRADLEGVGELRADLGRLRAELTEQLSGELFYERMVMRAQTVRGPLAGGGIDAPTIEGAASWETVTPASRPVVEVPRPPVPTPAVEPARPLAPEDGLTAEPVLEPRVEVRPESPIEWLGDRSLLGTAERPVVPVPASSPVLASAPATGARPVPFSRRDWAPDASAGTAPRHHRRAAETDEQPRVPEVVADAVPPLTGSHVVLDAPARQAPEPQGHARLEQILAESGVETPSGRRRRRYRDDDDGGDDVLSRVLGRH